jgi:DNA-binding MarR family transcriptional regulator
MPDASNPTPADAAEQIVAALAKLRGRRMPRPPWVGDGESEGHGGPWGRRGTHGHGGHGHGGPHGDHGFGGGGPHGMPGMPGWPAGPPARFGGPARLRLLEALAAASASLSVGEIAEAVGVDQPRASRLVQQSVDMGLVRREADPEDARRTRIALTETGAALARGFRGERTGAVESALDGFTDQERVDLARLLTKLAAAWPQG